jgi:uncharacterized protein (TIGR01244 family)
MSDFRRVTDEFWASPQIAIEDVAAARTQGFAVIVNNRPEAEVPGQPAGDEIEQAARAAGLGYIAIPVTPGGFSEAQVNMLVEALAEAEGPVLAFCRSGTRSTLLWCLAQAKLGHEPDEIARLAGGAGYDVAPIRPLLDRLAQSARE